jgi:hypothetical protein
MLYTVPNVEVFAAGNYSDGPVTTAELMKILTNFKTLQAQHKPPLGVGHDEDQAKIPVLLGREYDPWLKGPNDPSRTDQPAAGTVKNLRFVPDSQGGTLVADFVDVPAPIAKLINLKAFRKCSAEIYTYQDDQGNKYPNTLRRVSLLGFSPQRIKRLGDLPQAIQQYSELRPQRTLKPLNRITTKDSVICYSEVITMDKQAMLDAIAAKGVTLSPAAIAAMTDDDVNALYGQLCVDKSGEGKNCGDKKEYGGDKKMMKYADDRAMMIDELAGMGEDRKQLESLDDESLKKMYDSKKGAVTAGATITPAQTAQAYSEMQSAIREAQTAAAELKKYSEQMKLDRKLARVNEEVQQLGQAGKVTPAERDGIRIALLEASDEIADVRKYSENGKEYTQTPFAATLRRLHARPPVVRFGSQQGGPATDLLNPDSTEAEVGKVRMFAEEVASDLQKMGKTVEQKVREFKELQKADSTITAERFMGKKATA